MQDSFKREWQPKEWEAYSLRLAQVRHGAENVQSVPDLVVGDAGLEFFSTDGVAYQSYASQNADSTAKTTSGIKRKCRDDLKKLITNQSELKKVLGSIKLTNWILFVPLLEDKSAIATAQEFAQRVRDANLPFIAEDFHALIQCQRDFSTELEKLKIASLGPTISLTETIVATADLEKIEISEKLLGKLRKAYPSEDEEKVAKRARQHLKAHLRRENILNALYERQPVLWEKAFTCVEAEEERLATIGLASSLPAEQLQESINRVEKQLVNDLKPLEWAAIAHLSTGTVSEWLIRCPLDFD